ncbi:MAG TPA: hypothetical protein VG455_08515 [Acidimicrobiales bacterium]|nr:hypothetical protein [Acidimicrobiales bacterium]
MALIVLGVVLVLTLVFDVLRTVVAPVALLVVWIVVPWGACLVGSLLGDDGGSEAAWRRRRTRVLG